MPLLRCSSEEFARISRVLDAYPHPARCRANCRAPSALVRADTPIRKCPSASQISPPSTLPGGAIFGRSAKNSRRHSAMPVTSPWRLGAPGRVSTAPRPVTMAVSSTNVESGYSLWGSRDVTASPQSRSACTYAACCSRARATSGAPSSPLVKPAAKLRLGARTMARVNVISRWDPVSGRLIAPGFLGDLQLLLRLLHQRLRAIGAFRHRGAHADAHAHIAQHRRSRMMDSEVPDSFGHDLADAQCLLVGETRRECDQVPAVDARGHIARAAQGSGHDVRHAADRGIAGRTPKSCVVEVECVDVDREHGDAALFPLRDRPIALQQFLQIGQREQPRQTIVAYRDPRRLMRPAQRIPGELGVDAQ